MLSEIIESIGNECGYTVVTSSILDSTDVTTKMLLGMCNRVANEMADAFNWTRLRKTGSITLVASQDTYALPADFSHYHYETFWNNSTQLRLIGPLSDQDYAERISFDDSSTFSEFTIRGMTDNEMTIYPTPSSGNAGEVIYFQYTSARPIRPRTWAVGQTVVSGDYCFYNGVYYLSSSSGTTSGVAPLTDGGVTWAVYSGKYQSFLADTDEPVLSQRILEQGVMERFAAIKQLSVLPLFLNQLEEEYGKNAGGKTLYAGGNNSTRFQYARNGRVSFGS